MRLGLIGRPGAGKTTLFEALTQSGAETAQRKESRIGTVRVPDGRIDRLSAMYKPRKTIYAQVEYLLPAPAEHVKEKAREQSIWTQVRDCDAVLHVVRNFPDLAGAAPTPRADFQAVDQELILSDLVVVEKRLERLALDQKRGKKPDFPEEPGLIEQCAAHLNQEMPLRRFPEIAAAKCLRGFAFLSGKPCLVLFNNADEEDRLPDMSGWGLSEPCLAIRGKLEQELGRMSTEEAREFMAEFDIRDLAMTRVIHGSYALLGLISFFTVGEDEVRAWTVAKDSPAVKAAGKVHSDIERGFIRAEVVTYDDLIACGGLAEARKRGVLRLEGKTYPVKDGDIAHFLFSV
jgi:GTP-binding protein YchF